LKRSTTIDNALKTKLHTTPNAYASPSVYTLPPLATITSSPLVPKMVPAPTIVAGTC